MASKYGCTSSKYTASTTVILSTLPESSSESENQITCPFLMILPLLGSRILNQLQFGRKRFEKDTLNAFRASPNRYTMIKGIACRWAETFTIAGALPTL